METRKSWTFDFQKKKPKSPACIWDEEYAQAREAILKMSPSHPFETKDAETKLQALAASFLLLNASREDSKRRQRLIDLQRSFVVRQAPKNSHSNPTSSGGNTV